jgi:hypothetical protein
MKLVVAFAAALLLAAPAAAAPRLTPADRAAIARSIDTFVNHAVKRVDTGASFDVVAPEMRPAITRKQWAKGDDLPVYPFPARGTTHPWNVLYVTKSEVGLELELIPRAGSEQGPIIFHIYLRPVRGGRWLVDSFMPVATLAPIGKGKSKVRSVRDFSPQNAGGVSLGAGEPHRLSTIWLLIPFALVGAALIGFAILGVYRFFHNRRAYGPRARALPPLQREP